VRNWSAAPFTGLRNYRIALDFGGPIGSGLLHSFAITAAYTLIVIGLAYVMGLAGALLVNSEFRGRSWFRTLFLIPYALPVYVAVIAWSFMLDRDNGALNTLLVDDLHVVGHRPFWLLGTNAFWSIVMTTVWRLWPFAFLMILAGLQNIPRELYEAAALDGATPRRQLRYVTLPLLMPVTGVLLLVMFLWTFNEFNTPYVLFGQSPPGSADLISLHIYVNSFIDLNFGLGAAMSVLLLVFLMVATLVYLRVARIGRSVTNA
jgi:multiple sugar transport system permease protein